MSSPDTVGPAIHSTAGSIFAMPDQDSSARFLADQKSLIFLIEMSEQPKKRSLIKRSGNILNIRSLKDAGCLTLHVSGLLYTSYKQ